jgi:hypothetical protein
VPQLGDVPGGTARLKPSKNGTKKAEPSGTNAAFAPVAVSASQGRKSPGKLGPAHKEPIKIGALGDFKLRRLRSGGSRISDRRHHKILAGTDVSFHSAIFSTPRLLTSPAGWDHPALFERPLLLSSEEARAGVLRLLKDHPLVIRQTFRARHETNRAALSGL